MNEYIVEQLERLFPFIVKEAVTYKKYNDFEWLIILKDGSTVLYDEFSKTIRRLPNNSNELTEQECRKEFGARLRMRMDRAGVSQLELSNRTGIAQPQLSRYVTGKATPSFYIIDKIAKALRCSTDEFRYVD